MRKKGYEKERDKKESERKKEREERYEKERYIERQKWYGKERECVCEREREFCSPDNFLKCQLTETL